MFDCDHGKEVRFRSHLVSHLTRAARQPFMGCKDRHAERDLDDHQHGERDRAQPYSIQTSASASTTLSRNWMTRHPGTRPTYRYFCCVVSLCEVKASSLSRPRHLIVAITTSELLFKARPWPRPPRRPCGRHASPEAWDFLQSYPWPTALATQIPLAFLANFLRRITLGGPITFAWFSRHIGAHIRQHTRDGC